jgi:hypothetical protein
MAKSIALSVLVGTPTARQLIRKDRFVRYVSMVAIPFNRAGPRCAGQRVHGGT